MKRRNKILKRITVVAALMQVAGMLLLDSAPMWLPVALCVVSAMWLVPFIYANS